MQLVDISEIVVPEERIRKDFKQGQLESLAESISKNGLIHAPVVRDDGKTLIAGERRIRAIKLLYAQNVSFSYGEIDVPLGKVPVVPQSSLSEDAIITLELDENIRRESITWQEEAEAWAKIHQMTKEASSADNASSRPTFKQTADRLLEEFGVEGSERAVYGKLRESVILAEHLDDPEIAKVKDKKEALKLIEKKKEAEHRQRLAEEFNIKKRTTRHSLVKGSLLDILPTLPPSHFDCIIADPPYGIDADQFKNQSAVKHVYRDDAQYSDQIISSILNEGFRITKREAHLYMFCDIDRFYAIKAMAEAAGWYVWRTPLIWHKGDRFGLLPRPDFGPRRTYELILYAIKGDRKVKKVGMSDTLRIDHDTEVERAAHKPPELYANLISRSCTAGDRVLDPCCGTGPIFPAAENTSTVATGIEIEDDGYAWASQRLKVIEEGEV